MSFDEDFSLVVKQPKLSGNSLEEINASIKEYMKKYNELLEEQKELTDSTRDHRDLADQFQKRIIKLKYDMEEDQRSYTKQLADEEEKLNGLKQESSNLKQEILRTQAAIASEMAQNADLKEQTDVFSSMPERKFIFKGATGEWDQRRTFKMEPHVFYPMEGGTALVTFEEENVARRILSMKKHKVILEGDCSITVESRPVYLMLPKLVEIGSQVCPRRILVSNLPKMDTDTLVNKLEIHFSKGRNGGGEVDACEFLPDSGTVVITFVNDDIARGLTEKEFHEVNLQRNSHKVRVTPFLNGEIGKLETRFTVCPHTVLLVGIPDVMEQETLQDVLEIHFQKNGNGGGEIEAFLYNPLGRHNEAVFSFTSQP